MYPRNNTGPYLMLFYVLLLLLLQSCSRKTTVRTVTEYVQDSTAVQRLRKENDSISQMATRYRSEVTTLETQLASTTTGSGVKDSTLPVRSFRTENGPHYFDMQYQGNVVQWRFHIAQQQSSDRQVRDSSTYYRSRIVRLQDSIALLQISRHEKSEKTVITQEPGFWKRLWITLQNGWWLLIVGAFLYTFLRARIPFLP